MTLALFLFWASFGLVTYTYVVFPLVVWLRSVVRARPHFEADVTPTVTVVVAAYNEADAIGERVRNLLEQNYPPDRLEVVVASDGSTDGTDAVVGALVGPRVRLLALPRQGKAPALEAAAAAARGEILVFTDANSQFEPGAVRALVRPFADPAVGGVVGDQRYRKATGAGGERSYWSFDRWLKQCESRAGNAISATGAIYAIRRALFRGVPIGVTDDFAVSTRVIVDGHRLVFAPGAAAYEPAAVTEGLEFGRKVRIITRGLRGVAVHRVLLDPRRHGFYAVQLLSHKVLRRLMVFPLFALALSAPALWNAGPIYRAAALLQAAFYAAALAGAVLRGTRAGRVKPLAVPFYFCMVNLAALVAVWNVARGYRIERWEPKRAPGSATAR